MGEQTITLGEALGLIGWVIGIAIVAIGGLASIIVTLVLRNADRTSRDGREIARHTERTQDRTVDHAVDISKLDANVTMLMNDRGKCDELASQVAVLQDFQKRGERKFDEVDAASRELAGMSEQIKTLFAEVRSIPNTIGPIIAAAMPKAILDTMNAARSLPQNQPGRAANG